MRYAPDLFPVLCQPRGCCLPVVHCYLHILPNLAIVGLYLLSYQLVADNGGVTSVELAGGNSARDVRIPTAPQLPGTLTDGVKDRIKYPSLAGAFQKRGHANGES